MGVNFNHKDLIFSLKNEYPEFITKQLRKKNPLIDEIFIKQVLPPYRTGSGDNEKLWDKNEILVGKKRFPLTFLEDASGKLYILFCEKTIYSVKPSGGLTSKLIKTLSHYIKEALRE